MNEEEYDAFWKELTAAQEAEVHGFEDSQVFEGCMPVEVMARRGHDTLLYDPLKSRGLDDPRTGRWPYAVVQLRRDNAEGSVYNLVGFQTHLKFPEQKRVFSMIPALHNAEFLRYGVMHRNTFLDSPRLLDRYYRLKKEPRIAFAGQMTGVEGYVESTASGYLAGVSMAAKVLGGPLPDFPRETAIGALAAAVGALLALRLSRRIKRSLMGYEPDAFARRFHQREDILEALEEGILAIDREGRIIFLNAAAAQMLSLAPEAAMGRPLHSVYPSSTLDRILRTGRPEYNVSMKSLKDVRVQADRLPLY